MLEHGGRLRKAALEYGIAEADWLDLSSGLAPWPFPIPDIPLRAWARLPETDDGLEQAACEYYGAAQVLPVAGSQMAIQLLPRLRRVGKVGVLSPCYAEHAEAWRRSGYIVREVLEQEVDFFLDSLDVLVVVNPNNPTGLSLTPSRLLDWHSRLAQRGGWLVVDEAFMDNTPQLSLAPCAHQVGLIVLRSFGKFLVWPVCGWGSCWRSASCSNCSPNKSGPGPSADRLACWAKPVCRIPKATPDSGCVPKRPASVWLRCWKNTVSSLRAVVPCFSG